MMDDKCKLLAYGFSEHTKSIMPTLPSIIVLLYALYYFETDRFIDNKYDNLTNDNKTATCKFNTVNHFFGAVKLCFNFNQNVTYHWTLQINKNLKQAISIGIANSKFIQDYLNSNAKTVKEYVIYQTMRPFNMWLKSIKDGDVGFVEWERMGDYAEIPRLLPGDIVTLDIVLSQTGGATMLLYNEGRKLVNHKIELGLNKEYQLYISMHHEDNQITIKDFQSISID